MVSGKCNVHKKNEKSNLLFMKFGCYSSVAGAMGIVFPYLGEFQPTKYREKILCWMEIFWTVGIIALPGLKYPLFSYIYVYSKNFIKICISIYIRVYRFLESDI